jgi:hypothetical protein
MTISIPSAACMRTRETGELREIHEKKSVRRAFGGKTKTFRLVSEKFKIIF